MNVVGCTQCSFRILTSRCDSFFLSLFFLSLVVLQLRTCSSNFDENGVLYRIGTQGGTRNYQNPHTSGDVVVSWSSIENGTVDLFVQHRHANSVQSYTTNVANSWMQVDLGQNRTLRPTYYCLRNEQSVSDVLRNWRLEGSNDGQTWTTLRNHTNDTTLAAQSMSEANWPVENCGVCYRFFRILQYGKNAQNNDCLCCAGIELYGDLEE